MSTLQEVIELVDAIKPNAFDPAVKVAWINSLEGRIIVDVFQLPWSQAVARKHSADDLNTELLVRFPHDDIYEAWLLAKIDFANGEAEKDENSITMYNEVYDNFVHMIAMRFDPAQRTPEERETILGAYLVDDD